MGILEELKQILSEDQISVHPSHLEVASIDESSLPAVTPKAVVWAKTSKEISEIIKVCNKELVPVTVRGGGSALEGSTIPCVDGIVLDLSQMNKVIEYWDDDLQVKVEPGIIFDDLNNYLRKDGLFFPPSPGGSGNLATIGGMVSTNASGIFSVKYGGTKEYILQLELITGMGEIITIGSRAVKRSSGYNLTDLIVGSEGTLGVVSSVTLKLQGLPETVLQTAYQFENSIDAVKSVSEIKKYGIDIAAIEFLDEKVIEAVNRLKNFNLVESPYLFLEFHGSTISSQENKNQAEEICLDNNGKLVSLSENQKPWEIRHYLTEAIKHFDKNKKITRNDIAFPISKLPEVVEYCQNLSREFELPLFCFGHVGMGLLHALILSDKNDNVSSEKANQLNSLIIEKSLEYNGTVSGEHGIGLAHKEKFLIEHGGSVRYMKMIKKQFDPNNILNPGKIFDL